MKLSARRRLGFNQIQLLVIIAIIAILLALLLPAVQKVREAATRTESINNLKQMCLSLHSVNDAYRKLPPAYSEFGPIQFPAAMHVHLLPFIEQDQLYKDYAKQKGGGNTKNATLQVFYARQDESQKEQTPGSQNYAGNLRVFADKGINAAFNKPLPALGAEEKGNAAIPRTFIDGTSNTIVFATKLGVCGDDGGSKYAAPVNTKYAAFVSQDPAKVPASATDATATYQLAPNQKQCLCAPLMAQSFDPRGLQVGLGDGSVRIIAPAMSANTWNAAMQPNDGMVLGSDW